MCEQFFQVEKQGIVLSARVIPMGEDLCVAVWGGDRPHIGCAAVGVPRESLCGGGGKSATISTLNLTGHKDDAVANLVADRLASARGRPAAVVCGVHIDGITREQIACVCELAKALAEQILQGMTELHH
ncbi:hypothetical protein [Anaerotruncus rubiinfantis]|uniref:prenylated flavin chaperone LpdD n=1 Tax=Anaerotruncus rubiinfantis TaxID=1720200 RepID=UPI00189AF42A|nr:hypothetical protein [Anaerotruncus rubiinfantis]